MAKQRFHNVTPRSDMDENNFRYELDGFTVLMQGGELSINDISYEQNDDDPTYPLARAVYRLLHATKQ